MKKLRIQHRKERFMRTITIENCAQCPFSAKDFATSKTTLICNHLNSKMPLFNRKDRTIKQGDPIPTWCPIPDTAIAYRRKWGC